MGASIYMMIVASAARMAIFTIYFVLVVMVLILLKITFYCLVSMSK